MRPSKHPLADRLAEIGGMLQKLRWEALDAGQPDMASDIAHAIEAIAWAIGIASTGSNVVNRPTDTVTAMAQSLQPLRKSSLG